MNTDMFLQDCLKLWQDAQTSRDTAGEGTHLPLEEIFRMAKPGGVEDCPQRALQHLSLCPVCLKTWAEWRKALSAVADLETVDLPERESPSPMSYGMLKAAATEGPKGPVSLRSVCGRFVLSLLPQVDDPEKGMLTLEVVGPDDAALEGRHVTLCDTKGDVFLAGRLSHGRLARRSEDLSGIDLGTWTIVVEE